MGKTAAGSNGIMAAGKNALPETVERMEGGLGTKARQLGDYLLFTDFVTGEHE